MTVTRVLSPPMADAPLTNGHTKLNGALNGVLPAAHDALDAFNNGVLVQAKDAPAVFPNGPDSNPDSPAIDSPATPVDNSPTSDVKIDVDHEEHEESDVRHEQYPIPIDKLDNASTVPQIATPVDPGECPRALSCPTQAPHARTARRDTHRPPEEHTTSPTRR